MDNDGQLAACDCKPTKLDEIDHQRALDAEVQVPVCSSYDPGA